MTLLHLAMWRCFCANVLIFNPVLYFIEVLKRVTPVEKTLASLTILFVPVALRTTKICMRVGLYSVPMALRTTKRCMRVGLYSVPAPLSKTKKNLGGLNSTSCPRLTQRQKNILITPPPTARDCCIWEVWSHEAHSPRAARTRPVSFKQPDVR